MINRGEGYTPSPCFTRSTCCKSLLSCELGGSTTRWVTQGNPRRPGRSTPSPDFPHVPQKWAEFEEIPETSPRGVFASGVYRVVINPDFATEKSICSQRAKPTGWRAKDTYVSPHVRNCIAWGRGCKRIRQIRTEKTRARLPEMDRAQIESWRALPPSNTGQGWPRAATMRTI